MTSRGYRHLASLATCTRPNLLVACCGYGTGAERKAFAAEVGRIIAKLAENCQSGIFANGKEVVIGNWVDDLAKNTGTPERTIRFWWTAFTKDTNRDITPKKATDADKQAFFDWLDAQKAKDDAEKARKAALMTSPRGSPVAWSLA